MSKLKDLMAKGYLPIQLPPPFVSDSFSVKSSTLAQRWKGVDLENARIERFSVARSSYNRRITSIPNPVPFFFLSRELATSWREIRAHFRKSRLSLSKPRFGQALRAIQIPRFSALFEEKLRRSKGYRYMLVTDISRYFPTIYTHTLPWALHTRPIAKKRRKDKTLLGNRLDGWCQRLQDGQTIGLPIGPDTSHILSEVIGVAIDAELKRVLGKWPAGFRYVDDFYLFFSTREEAEHALRELVRCMADFELHFNPDKTRIAEISELVEDSWKYRLHAMRMSPKISEQKNDLHHYFEGLFALTSTFKDESVVKYGLRLLSGKIVKRPNWGILEAYLLKCGYTYPNTLQTVVTVLLTYASLGFPIDRKAISRFCNTLLSTHAVSDGHSEIAWILWLAKNLKLKIAPLAARAIQTTSSSVCLLLALDLKANGLLPAGLPKSALVRYATTEALWGTNWLVAYEAGRRRWLGNVNTDFINADPHFSVLLAEGVSFYEEMAVAKPVFMQKNEFDLNLLQSDDDIHNDFEFLEVDDEYFDSSEDAEDAEPEEVEF